MSYRYFIHNGDKWVECRVDLYNIWSGKKYKSSYNVLDDLNNNKIPIETSETNKDIYSKFTDECNHLGLFEKFTTQNKAVYDWMLMQLQCRFAKGFINEDNNNFEIRFK